MDLLFLVIFGFMMVIMVLVGIMVVAYVWLTPVLPYIRAKLDKKDILFLIGKDNKVRLIPAKYSSGMYTSTKPPYSFIQRVPKSYRFGELSAVFVHDGWGVVLDPDMLEALRTLSDKGYTTYESLAEALENGDLVEEDIIRIHAFKDIEFHTIMDYVGELSPGQIRAHLDERMASFIEQYKNLGVAQSSTNWPLMILLIAGAAVGGFFLLKSMGMM